MTTITPVNTTKVQGRRTLRYESFDDVLADAERLAKVPVRTLGNWSQGQIYKHLAFAINMMIDGTGFSLPAPVRFLFRIFMKKRMLTRTLDPGFKLPKKAEQAIPSAATSLEEGLEELRLAVERIKSTDQRAMHPGFGNIPREEWDAFQLRHCEMHMSFIVPESTANA